MIYLYSGTPGSGKSLHQARDAYYWLKAGKPLIANYEINMSNITHCKKEINFTYVANADLTPSKLIELSKLYFQYNKFGEGKIRLYLDEAQILFNAREWQKTQASKWIEFFSQHRKYGYDIFLIAQFDRMIDRQIRSLIEYEYVHRKVSNFGWKGKLLSLCAGGNLFCSVKMWYPMRERIGADFFRAQKRFYRLYDTFNAFSDEGNKSANVVTKSKEERKHFSRKTKLFSKMRGDKSA